MGLKSDLVVIWNHEISDPRLEDVSQVDAKTVTAFYANNGMFLLLASVPVIHDFYDYEFIYYRHQRNYSQTSE